VAATTLATTLVLPFLPFAALLGLTPLAPSALALLVLIVAAYVASGEMVKRLFYRLAEPPAAAFGPSARARPGYLDSVQGSSRPTLPTIP